MLKTISAALLAASVIAAPALAAEAGKDTGKTAAPVIKVDQAQTKTSTTTGKTDVKAGAKTDVKRDVKADAKSDAKSDKAMNANAAIAKDEPHKSVRTHRHHHKAVSANKQLKTQPDLKPAAPVTTGKRS